MPHRMPTLTDLLRRELLEARRGGHRAVAATLRSTLAALDNAEAVPVEESSPTTGTEYVAGAGAVGATEASRRQLSEGERVGLVRAEIAELEDAAATYADREPDRAAAARDGIGVLERVLVEHDGA